jgi:hypothetical protein
MTNSFQYYFWALGAEAKEVNEAVYKALRYKRSPKQVAANGREAVTIDFIEADNEPKKRDIKYMLHFYTNLLPEKWEYADPPIVRITVYYEHSDQKQDLFQKLCSAEEKFSSCRRNTERL